MPDASWVHMLHLSDWWIVNCNCESMQGSWGPQLSMPNRAADLQAFIFSPLQADGLQLLWVSPCLLVRTA